MSLPSLPPLREALEHHGLLAKKSFGQHFLLDLNITRKIARLAEVGPGDQVLEIGPGPGGLTRALLETGCRVTAIEKDPRFLPLLADLAAQAEGRLTLIEGDALTTDPRDHGCEQAHVVANLPYNVGTPLLIQWLTGPFQPSSMTLMFQKEVAERIIAPTGGEAYGRLAVLCRTLCEARIIMDLPARAFTPPPKVDSAVVRLIPRSIRPDADLIRALEQVTGAAFGQRRKMLRASLKVLGGEDLCHAAAVAADVRAETVDLEGFLRLAREVLVRFPPPAGPRSDPPPRDCAPV